MENTAKFTFDTEFRRDGDRPSPEALGRQRKTLSVVELERLRAEARSEGEGTAGIRAAEILNRQIAALTIALRAVLDQSHAEIETLRGEAAHLALAMARKLAPAAIAALPVADVETALRQALHQAIGEPRVTLHASPAIVAALESSIAAIAAEESYDGRVLLAAEPGLSAADCRIEWRGGGSEHREQTVADALEALVAHCFSSSSGKG